GVGQKLTADKTRLAIALVAATIMLMYTSAWMHIIIILGAGLLGLKIFKDKAEPNVKPFSVNISKKPGLISLSILVFTLIALPILTSFPIIPLVRLFDPFFRVGFLVLGGGYLVFLMLEREIVPQGLILLD